MKTEETIEEKNERLAGNIMIPYVVWNHFLTVPHQPLPENARAYIEELETYAFIKNYEYSNFRLFLATNRNLFGERYAILERITKDEIDHILNRVREEQLKKITAKEAKM